MPRRYGPRVIQYAADGKVVHESGQYADEGKVGKVMGEFKRGELHSGSKRGPEVTDRKQAVAIAMKEAGKSKKK